MTISTAIIATHRFGLGPRPGELAKTSRDPHAWLLAQVDAPPPAVPGLGSAREVLQLQRELREARQNDVDPQQLTRRLRELQSAGIAARTRHAIATDRPFVERLALFWTNHFAISTDKATTASLGGPFEAEAIRPHLMGNFRDLLLASSKHPGMLNYLDNSRSIGPNSQAGSRRDAGLNENLAREILELHTLGVDGGYTQDDVTSLARIITGWTVAAGPIAERFGAIEGTFAFIPALHEPGTHRVLGTSYRQPDIEQGEAVLTDLAAHPSTARHIAFKLARHFIADDPPERAVARLEQRFVDTNGDLPSLYRELVAIDDAWLPQPQKFRTPNEWLVAVLRGSGLAVRDAALQTGLVSLGQVPWRPGSPAGWPDVASAWNSADAIDKRIEWANAFAQRTAALPAEEVAATLFGDAVPEPTLDAIRRAESNTQALTLLLLSPELLRR